MGASALTPGQAHHIELANQRADSEAHHHPVQQAAPASNNDTKEMDLLEHANLLTKLGFVAAPYFLAHALSPVDTPGSSNVQKNHPVNNVNLNYPPAGEQANFKTILEEVRNSDQIRQVLTNFVRKQPLDTIIPVTNLIVPKPKPNEPNFAFKPGLWRSDNDLYLAFHGLTVLNVSGHVNEDGSANLIVVFADIYDFDHMDDTSAVAHFNNEAWDLQTAGILHPFTIVGAVTFYVPAPYAPPLAPSAVATTPSSPDQSQQEQDAAYALYDYDLRVGAFNAKGPVGDSEVFAQGVQNGTVTAAVIDAAIAALPRSSTNNTIASDIVDGSNLLDAIFIGFDAIDTGLSFL